MSLSLDSCWVVVSPQPVTSSKLVVHCQCFPVKLVCIAAVTEVVASLTVKEIWSHKLALWFNNFSKSQVLEIGLITSLWFWYIWCVYLGFWVLAHGPRRSLLYYYHLSNNRTYLVDDVGLNGHEGIEFIDFCVLLHTSCMRMSCSMKRLQESFLVQIFLLHRRFRRISQRKVPLVNKLPFYYCCK